MIYTAKLISNLVYYLLLVFEIDFDLQLNLATGIAWRIASSQQDSSVVIVVMPCSCLMDCL